MEAIIFVGLPGSGKSSFYKERFFNQYVRISLDLLKTRNRETRLLDVCLETCQQFVIDNTNPTKADRSRFIEVVKSARLQYTISGYYFESKVEDCLQRNARRPASERVPKVAILSKAAELQRPSLDEGFDQLFFVRLTEVGFVVEEWNDEV